MSKPVCLTAYAKAKLVFLREHGFPIAEETVIRTVREPEHVSRVRLGRWVAQRTLSREHLLRVIYEEQSEERVVITFYPARRSRYEPTHEV